MRLREAIDRAGMTTPGNAPEKDLAILGRWSEEGSRLGG